MKLILIYAIYLFTEILSTALILRALFSWFAANPYGVMGKIYRVLVNFTEPIVEPCRNFMSRFRTGMLDFSIMVALLLVQCCSGILIRLLYML